MKERKLLKVTHMLFQTLLTVSYSLSLCLSLHPPLSLNYVLFLGNSRIFSLCSANSVSPHASTQRTEKQERDSGKPYAIDNSILCIAEPFPGSKKVILC